jgi:hypothetical protein
VCARKCVFARACTCWRVRGCIWASQATSSPLSAGTLAGVAKLALAEVAKPVSRACTIRAAELCVVPYRSVRYASFRAQVACAIGASAALRGEGKGAGGGSMRRERKREEKGGGWAEGSAEGGVARMRVGWRG